MTRQIFFAVSDLKLVVLYPHSLGLFQLLFPQLWHIGLALQLGKRHSSLELRGVLLTCAYGRYDPLLLVFPDGERCPNAVTTGREEEAMVLSLICIFVMLWRGGKVKKHRASSHFCKYLLMDVTSCHFLVCVKSDTHFPSPLCNLANVFAACRYRFVFISLADVTVIQCKICLGT